MTPAMLSGEWPEAQELSQSDPSSLSSAAQCSETTTSITARAIHKCEGCGSGTAVGPLFACARCSLSLCSLCARTRLGPNPTGGPLPAEPQLLFGRTIKDWQVVPMADSFPGENLASLPCSSWEDVNHCRAQCALSGCGGFTLWNGRAYFRPRSRWELLAAFYTCEAGPLNTAPPELHLAPPRCADGDHDFHYIEPRTGSQIAYPRIPGIAAAEKVATVAGTVATVALARSGFAAAGMVSLLAHIGGAVGAASRLVEQECAAIVPSGSHPDIEFMLTVDLA